MNEKTHYHFTLATGWIAPNGQYFSCYVWDHDPALLKILKNYFGYENPTVELGEKLGFVRCMGITTKPFLNTDKLTQNQLDTMFDYCQKCGFDYNF